ncbi:hypothetical protein P152DRAFT_450177 [Eremomyces bilateralis CBS 781.70]|uniref:Uncharacterized protein n=1 Tax=Eremomyces bilateralis CBS 781.70 TaxID=1392243 RepID=A0A6G1G0L1_9PEZI|nr:uncharacterized protein P152DRAFT_450177 [Eremomyces bilateralis CBS 781.70]KAF1811460.1 hypothetical protein P152DRAFT_450177 [Eremomyces bilateralis CBS 781.70]
MAVQCQHDDIKVLTKFKSSVRLIFSTSRFFLLVSCTTDLIRSIIVGTINPSSRAGNFPNLNRQIKIVPGEPGLGSLMNKEAKREGCSQASWWSGRDQVFRLIELRDPTIPNVAVTTDKSGDCGVNRAVRRKSAK